MGKLQQIVGFRVGQENFGVPISLVHEIVPMMEITAVPDAPQYIEGVVNLRGKIIPVMDLRKRFAEAAVPARRNRIMVAELDGHMVGLVVDAANEVLKIDPEAIEPPPNVFEKGEVNYVTGVGKLSGKLIILIDLARVMQRGELRRISEVAASAGALPPAV
ncbi:MAG: chemotaxis protein CheW [Acidobacteriota bacterium]|nr:chemotaxis protein CheW [Acidobacteriota bacterium]